MLVNKNVYHYRYENGITQWVKGKYYLLYINYVGHMVAQLVEALRYKSEGRGFESQWCHSIF